MIIDNPLEFPTHTKFIQLFCTEKMVLMAGFENDEFA